jgi:hypothetical protein
MKSDRRRSRKKEKWGSRKWGVEKEGKWIEEKEEEGKEMYFYVLSTCALLRKTSLL